MTAAEALARGDTVYIINRERGERLALAYARRQATQSPQYVYLLSDPHTHAWRYVGRSADPRRRLQEHMRRSVGPIPGTATGLGERPYYETLAQALAAGEALTVRAWLHGLQEEGAAPSLDIVEKVTPAYRIFEREIRWIAHCIQQGAAILNDDTVHPSPRYSFAARARASRVDWLQAPLSDPEIHAALFHRAALPGALSLGGDYGVLTFLAKLGAGDPARE